MRLIKGTTYLRLAVLLCATLAACGGCLQQFEFAMYNAHPFRVNVYLYYPHANGGGGWSLVGSAGSHSYLHGRIIRGMYEYRLEVRTDSGVVVDSLHESNADLDSSMYHGTWFMATGP